MTSMARPCLLLAALLAAAAIVDAAPDTWYGFAGRSLAQADDEATYRREAQALASQATAVCSTRRTRGFCNLARNCCFLGGSCTDTDKKTDNDNCGFCGRKCADPLICDNGSCRCPNKGTRCTQGGVVTCKDIVNSVDSCGSCSHVCAAGSTCERYACKCPSGLRACGRKSNADPGACTDVKSDAQNCGFCGRKCRSTQQCTNGRCVAATSPPPSPKPSPSPTLSG